MKATYLITTFFALLLLPKPVNAQEETSYVLKSAKTYIDFNIKGLEKYNQLVAKQQSRLLSKLKRKEAKYCSRLKRKDSTAYVKLQNQSPSFDSIDKLNKQRAFVSDKKFIASSPAVDSLNAIQNFAAGKIHLEGGTNNKTFDYSDRLNSVRVNQGHNDQIANLISRRSINLKSAHNVSKGKISGLKGIDKQLFYSRAKISVFKNIADEPSKSEEVALEMLQGLEGFEQYISSNAGEMMLLQGKGTSASDLERMGYQTKRQVTGQLQQKLGSSVANVQGNLGKQIADYQKDFKKVQDAGNNLKQAERSMKRLHIESPSFKINPMRTLPLSKRIEKQINWQTNRATSDGQPAVFMLSAMAGFKHTPKLTYGLGIATSIGLGQNWSNVRISFQGLGLRTYAAWQLVYGIGAYGGYERMYKQALFFDDNTPAAETNTTLHDTKIYNESVLIGLTKTYNISKKWNGSLQVLYDIWWKEKGMRSPIVLRISNITK